MKKIDKLIIRSFLGPFFLTFVIVSFILLNVQMLKYYDDLMGKGLSTGVILQLFVYFGIFVTPTAFPLAVLLSSLMTFGNLGEHFELTALKGAGISLVRALLPIFIFVLGLTGIAFYSNNNLVPKAALEFYSLLYDIKQKKPAFDLKQGIFYQGIPDFSIKVNDKLDDGQTLKDVIIYDHRDVSGNKKVTLADSGRMSTILNERYLKLELFNGNTYIEDNAVTGRDRPVREETMTRSSFDKNEFVMDLSSFKLGKTDKELFQSNRIMRNMRQLRGDVDSTQKEITRQRILLFQQKNGAFYYHSREDSLQLPEDLRKFKEWDDSVKLVRRERRMKARRDSLRATGQEPEDSILRQAAGGEENYRTGSTIRDPVPGLLNRPAASDSTGRAESARSADANAGEVLSPPKKSSGKAETIDVSEARKNRVEIARQKVDRSVRLQHQENEGPSSAEVIAGLRSDSLTDNVVTSALSLARQTKMKILGVKGQMDRIEREQDIFEIQWHKILSNALACISMFLIGAPLGAIIKRGGLGVPVIVSIVFFILFYVISMQGEKFARSDMIEPWLGVWASNMVLLPIGFFFLRQARNDARLFDTDFYLVTIDKIRQWRRKLRSSKKK